MSKVQELREKYKSQANKEKALKTLQYRMQESAFKGHLSHNFAMCDMFPLNIRDLREFADKNDLNLVVDLDCGEGLLNWEDSTSKFGQELLEATPTSTALCERVFDRVIEEIEKQFEQDSLKRPVVQLKLIEMSEYMTATKTSHIERYLLRRGLDVMEQEGKYDEDYTITVSL